MKKRKTNMLFLFVIGAIQLCRYLSHWSTFDGRLKVIVDIAAEAR